MNRKKYGQCSSWAVWDAKNNDLVTNDVTGSKLNSIVKTFNKKSLTQSEINQLNLNPNTILIALNFSECDKHDVSKKNKYPYYTNFHEEKTSGKRQTNDPRLKEACKMNKSILWGAYMTDLLKWKCDNKGNCKDTDHPTGIIKSDSKQVGEEINKVFQNEFQKIQVTKLIDEIKSIYNPNIKIKIVCMHSKVKSIVSKFRNSFFNKFGENVEFYSIPHYAKMYKYADDELYFNDTKSRLKKALNWKRNNKN